MNAYRIFSRYAWLIVGFLILVILWGAWVRITGSGAGCGNHWPTCNGEVIPLAPTTKTLIEFIHRLSSGLCLPLVLILMGGAWRLFPSRHPVRWAAGATLFFLCSEAALGAGLVKFELVAENTSMARAITAAFHLVNTFALVSAAALTAWWSRQSADLYWQHPHLWLLCVALVALILTSMSGAVTALGDTLFPTSVFVEGGLIARLREDLSASTHFLVQLRLLHPLLAVGSALYLLFLSFFLRAEYQTGPRIKACFYLMGLTIFQFLAGFINILLAAPGWMQIIHLFLAVCVNLNLIILLAIVLAESPDTLNFREKRV